MEEVFILHHVRSHDDGGDDVKLIGAYRSEENARAAISRLSDQPGFRDHLDGFEISPYPLDKDHWKEGFISWAEALPQGQR